MVYVLWNRPESGKEGEGDFAAVQSVRVRLNSPNAEPETRRPCKVAVALSRGRKVKSVIKPLCNRCQRSELVWDLSILELPETYQFPPVIFD